METCFNYCSKDEAFFSSDERRWISYIRRLKQQRPDEVMILKEPEDNDGCIYCKLPPSVLKIRFPRQLTEEQRQAVADNLAKARLSQTHGN